MTQSVCILGRQPALGIAELESLFGAQAITRAGNQAVILDVPPEDVHFNRLGGSVRLAKLLTILPFTDWNRIERYIAQQLPKHIVNLPEGKIHFGLSTYGLQVTTNQINSSALTLKKVIKNEGRSIRVVPNKAAELNTAQVLHNRLYDQLGMELILIRDDKRTVLAQTTAVQNIEAYAARDQVRPKRDARVGMLPPKLAQIIINLAKPEPGVTVLDPFCGTGVVLQEALIMGYNAYGTDLEPRMVEYSKENLEWLTTKFNVLGTKFNLAVGDATKFQWSEFGSMACETYLGRPFSAIPPPEVMDAVMRDVDLIHKKFLRNVAAQTKPGFRLCIAVPAWKTKYGFKHLKTLDSLADLGYTRVSFVHSSDDTLVYHRENQIVARELITLIRK